MKLFVFYLLAYIVPFCKPMLLLPIASITDIVVKLLKAPTMSMKIAIVKPLSRILSSICPTMEWKAVSVYFPLQ